MFLLWLGLSILGTVHIQVTLKSLPSHQRIKDDLTTYITQKAILNTLKSKKNITVNWRNETKSILGTDLLQLAGSHEKADTKILYTA